MKIKSITRKQFSGKVYNFSCTPHHTYVANSVVVHNCDVPNIPFKGNASFDDLKKQLYSAINLFPGVKYTDRLNIHFARMGEPIFNRSVFDFATWMYMEKDQIQKDTGLRIEVLHPVLTTSLPKRFVRLEERIKRWTWLKNDLYNGQAGLQLSINSTDDKQRDIMFGNESLALNDVSSLAQKLDPPLGRKYCLNFAYSTDFIIDAKKLKKLFDPDMFMCKITPIHNNKACKQNKICTVGGYESYAPYKQVEAELKDAGFDVLVFIPSMDEENGLVTCGNLVLGGGKINTKPHSMNIQGV